MKRLAVSVLLLTFPVLTGFECTVSGGGSGVWVRGDTCIYALDYADATCLDNGTLLRCAEDDVVEEWTCASSCDGGYCDRDSRLGYDWCLCPDWQWAAGYSCNYQTDFSENICDGNVWVYCGEDNVIAEVECDSYCLDYFGNESTGGTCGAMDEGGNQGCVCDLPPSCTFTQFCQDATIVVTCKEGVTTYESCDTICVDQNYTKGVCINDECLCG